jgi:predicted ATPase
VFDVLPLELPDATGADASQVSGAPAVRLLLEQAEQSGIGFSLNDENRNVITTICRRLDGLPLAIELATSWLRVLSPEQLLERLNQRLSALGGGARDAPARHQTLWDTIAWSLDNLTVGEQRLFRRMAVFTGGATLDTIRHVAAGNDPHDIELMDALSSLVDKSLVRRQEFPAGEPRFFMLETIREFARELLEQSGEAGEFRSAQVAWIVDLTARAEPELVGPNETQWRELLALEQPNVRAALDWSISQGYFESALRISGAMWRFWSKRDLLEGREWFLRVLELPGEPDPETRARALQALANILHDLGDFPGAQTRFEAALAIRKTLPDKSLQANSLNGLGIVAFAQGEFDRARELHQESLALSREAGHLVGIGNALSNWSTVERALGQLDRSKALQEEALQVRREFGDEHFIAYSLYNLGTIARAGGRLDDARGLFDEALRLFRSAGDRFGIAFALTDLGVVNQQLGDPELSAAAMREAIAIRQDMGDRRGLIDCFEGVASIAVALQLDQRAATLLGFALRQRANLRSPQTPAERTDVERWSASGQNRLGSAAYNRILASGGDLGVQTAIELAEEVLEEMINSTGVGKA